MYKYNTSTEKIDKNKEISVQRSLSEIIYFRLGT